MSKNIRVSLNRLEAMNEANRKENRQVVYWVIGIVALSLVPLLFM
jgi:hypothetical protein